MPLSKLKADSLNLGDTFVFTGNVTGEATGALNLLQTQTASSSLSISFTTGIDSTYDEYWFIFNNCHPATDNADFTFSGSIDSGSNYNTTKTTTHFTAFQNEAGTDTSLNYSSGTDLAQSTSFVQLGNNTGADNDQCVSGLLKLYNPSSTTYVKHFIGMASDYSNTNYHQQFYLGGYFNTTSAIDAIQFKFSSGDIDDGTIQLFGVTK